MKERQTGGGQEPEAQLTWGATIVQSLANSTCPERAKTMMFRKLVNHITHSKSATSWTAGAGSNKAVRAVEPEEPELLPHVLRIVAIGVCPHSEGGVQERGMDEGPKGQACSLKLPCTLLIPDILPHSHPQPLLPSSGRQEPVGQLILNEPEGPEVQSLPRHTA